MNRKLPHLLSLIPLTLGVFSGPFLWSQGAVNFVRDSVQFSVVDSFGTDNEINNFATDGGRFPVGLSFSDFEARLQAAYSMGFGGVINFDNPVYGSAFVDLDRSGVRRFIEQREEDLINEGVVFDTPPERQSFIESARAEAYASGIVDPNIRIPIIARRDRGLNDVDLLPEVEQVFFKSIVALFGENRDQQLILRQGPQNYIEGDRAMRAYPGSEDLAAIINDSYPWSVGRGTYSGGQSRAMSQPFSFDEGLLDILIDSRNNVTALGFVLMSVNNFQYWQGLGGTPDNADNIRVLAEFSDGTSELLTSTTAQSNAGWDTFFGIGAPEGTSITRLKVRIAGRGWRTFVLMDDLAFVTERSLPFLISEDTASVALGERFFYDAVFGQAPTDITVSGLPEGLSYDAETRFIVGAPEEVGEFEVLFTLTNEIGTIDESLSLRVLEPVAEERLPRFSFFEFEQSPNQVLADLDILQIENSREIVASNQTSKTIFLDFSFDVLAFLDGVFNPWALEGDWNESEDPRIFDPATVQAVLTTSAPPETVPADFISFSFTSETTGDSPVLRVDTTLYASGTFIVSVPLQNLTGSPVVAFEFPIRQLRGLPRDASVAGWEPEWSSFGLLQDGISVETVLRNSIVPHFVAASVDPEDLANVNRFTTRVYRLNDDGSRDFTSIAAAGLGFQNQKIQGRPTLPTSIGRYEVEIIGFNRFSADSFFIMVTVLPPVPQPNFDSSLVTDLAWFDSSTGMVSVLIGNEAYFDEDELTFGVKDWSALVRAAPFAVGSSSLVSFGFFDANNTTDILLFDRSGGKASLVLLDEDEPGRMVVNATYEDLTPSWLPLFSGDMEGQGLSSILWQNEANDRFALWQTANGELTFASVLLQDGIQREFLFATDFTGDALQEILFRRGPNQFELVKPTVGTTSVSIERIGFTLPSPDWQPHMAADLTGNGAQDLIWKNQYSGEVTFWPMGGRLQVPDSVLLSEENESDPLEAGPGRILIPFSQGLRFELITVVDVNEDQVGDLVLRDRGTGELFLQVQSPEGPAGAAVPLPVEMDHPQVVSIGDFNADRREDLIVRDSVSGETVFLLLGPDGIIDQHRLGSFSPQVEFLTPRPISTDLSLPPGRDDAIAPWEGAHPLGDRWFYSPWFGFFWDPAEGYIFHTGHGFQWVFGESAAEGIWLHDSALEWLWTNSDTYPWLFFPRFGSWIYYDVRSVIPNRWFYESAQFAEWVMESDL